MKLKGKLIIMGVVPLLVLVIILSLFTKSRVSTVISDTVEEDLMATAELQKEAVMDIDGDYRVDENGDLFKGDVNLTTTTTIMDNINKQSKIALTIFYGDTRYSTSVMQDGERVLGTQAGEKVIDTVLKKGENYFASNVDVVGENYFAYYVPLYTSENDTTPIGMIFAGKSQDTVNKEINSIINAFLLIAIILSILCIAGIYAITYVITLRLKNGVHCLEEITQGNLLIDIDERLAKGKDETSDIVRAVIKLKASLGDIVGQIMGDSSRVHLAATQLKHGAVEAQTSIDQVERAMSEVAEGATSQAADTQTATTHVITMGQRIEETNNNVEHLTTNADKMESHGLQAKDTLQELETINAEVQRSIDTIYEQTNTTNESAQRISEAINLITSIAEETNLLSLNASIEAARAGEQGRGFAVVASQIQKLAEQSNTSATQISEYINSLMIDSENAVSTMEEVKATMQKQSTMLEKTDEVFFNVLDGIERSRQDISKISQNTKDLDEARVSVVDIVQNLSAVSEEYAASTEETSAAATQVSQTVQDISQNAVDMQQIATELKDSVSIFKVFEVTNPEAEA